MPDFEDKVRIKNVKAVKQTAKALLVKLLDDDGREVWIPQSQIDDDSEVFEEGGEGELVINQWFAEKEGLEP